MATFEYEALTDSGRRMKGTLDAASPDEAIRLLDGMALSVQSIEQAAPARPRTRIGRNEFLLFNQQLASLAKAGIPLESGLRHLAKEVASRRLRGAIDGVAADLEAGKPLEEAFERHARHFPPLYARLIGAGVRTGRLGELLTSLSRHLETARMTRRIVVEAVAYPVVLLLLAGVILTFLFLVVMPRMAEFLAGFDTTLPPLTLSLMWVSEHFVSLLLLTGGAFVGVVVAWALLGTWPKGRYIRERFVRGVPVVGRVQRLAALARLADTMGLMVGSGCTLPEALRQGSAAAGSEVLRQACEGVADRVERGEPLADAARDCRAVPTMFFYSMQIGAERNELADNLYQLSDMYASQARAHQGRLQAFLLPILIIGVGTIIGFYLSALFMPLTKLIRSVIG